jgi:hypothetical protein
MVIGMDDDGEWINATDMMLKYHQEQLKLLNIDFVSEPFCKCAEPKIYYTRVMNCEACENCGKEVYVR